MQGNPMPGERETLTFREALSHFATKTEMAAVDARTANLASKIDQLVPRPEHELHWLMDDEFKVRVREQLQRIADELDAIKADRLPKWALPFIGIIAPIVMAITLHYWK